MSDDSGPGTGRRAAFDPDEVLFRVEPAAAFCRCGVELRPGDDGRWLCRGCGRRYRAAQVAAIRAERELAAQLRDLERVERRLRAAGSSAAADQVAAARRELVG